MGWTNLPSGSGKDVFVALIPATFYDLASVRFILLHGRVGEQPHIVMDVKVEQRPRLATRFVDYKVIKCVMLYERR
jgi:hypothetical protein